MEKVVLKVDGMNCQRCAENIKRAIGKLDGIEKVEVDIENKEVSISFYPSAINKDAFIKAIQDAGYEVV
ncbi:MAG: heavy-metal-associated domain-containing protein [Firmicutes bacterium]|nr:heavy-metal-associated domain-containing protein [Bacillota bacterium]